MDGDDGEFGSVEEDGDEGAGRPPTKRRRVFIYPRSVTQETWKRREGVVRQSCTISIIILVVCKLWIRHAIRGRVVRWSYSGPFKQSRRSHVEGVSCDRITEGRRWSIWLPLLLQSFKHDAVFRR